MVSSPRISTPALGQGVEERGREFLRHGAVNEQRLDGVADAGPLNLGGALRMIFSAMAGSAPAWTKTEQMPSACLITGTRASATTVSIRALAAPGDNHVDEFALAAEEGDQRPVGVVDELHRAPGQRGAFLQGGDERAVGVDRLLAAAQHGGVAGLEAEDGGVDGDVGARLEDDGDDSDGDAHLRDPDAVGLGPFAELFAQRLGQVRRTCRTPATMARATFR